MRVRLHRTWYRTDATDDDMEYQGAFSAAIPAPGHGVNRESKIVAVDWSQRGIVEVTWMIPADNNGIAEPPR